MKRFLQNTIKKALEESGHMQQATDIERKLGFMPIDYTLLETQDASDWLKITCAWIDLLSDEAMQNRILQAQNDDPSYIPQLDYFSILFSIPVKTVGTFLTMLDEASMQAIDAPFFDELLPTTFPPHGGPFYDLLAHIGTTYGKIPPGLLDILFIEFPLILSTKPKSILDPHSLTNQDIKFVGDFLWYLSQNISALEKIANYRDDDAWMSVLPVAFMPQQRLSTLRWNKHLIDECFKQLDTARSLYEENPKATILLYLGEDIANSLSSDNPE